MNSREQNHMNRVPELSERGTLSARLRDVRVSECERNASQQKTPSRSQKETNDLLKIQDLRK